MHIFKKSKIQIKEKIAKHGLKNCMFFGIWILKAFWVDFGRALASQNLGLEAKNLPKLGFKPMKIDIKLKLRKIAKKARNLRPGPWLPGGRPLEQNPPRMAFQPRFLKK